MLYSSGVVESCREDWRHSLQSGNGEHSKGGLSLMSSVSCFLMSSWSYVICSLSCVLCVSLKFSVCLSYGFCMSLKCRQEPLLCLMCFYLMSSVSISCVSWSLSDVLSFSFLCLLVSLLCPQFLPLVPLGLSLISSS